MGLMGLGVLGLLTSFVLLLTQARKPGHPAPVQASTTSVNVAQAGGQHASDAGVRTVTA